VNERSREVTCVNKVPKYFLVPDSLPGNHLFDIWIYIIMVMCLTDMIWWFARKWY